MPIHKIQLLQLLSETSLERSRARHRRVPVAVESEPQRALHCISEDTARLSALLSLHTATTAEVLLAVMSLQTK